MQPDIWATVSSAQWCELLSILRLCVRACNNIVVVIKIIIIIARVHDACCVVVITMMIVVRTTGALNK